MSVRPDVSVIIPAWNRREFLLEAVASACCRQGVTVEVIVADDGSTDGSLEAVRAEFPEVVTLSLSHQGACAARNSGLAQASGRYVKFLDSDDLLEPGSLEAQVRFADTLPSHIVYGDFLFFGDLDAHEVGGEALRRAGRPDDLVAAVLLSWWTASSAYLYPAAAAAAVRWDNSLSRFQDTDYILQMLLKDVPVVYLPGIAARMRVHHRGRIMDMAGLQYGLNAEKLADKVQAALKEKGRLNEERAQALAEFYWSASRSVYGHSAADYERLIDKVRVLRPRFRPRHDIYGGPALRLVVGLLGPKRAEKLFDLRCRLTGARRALPGRSAQA